MIRSNMKIAREVIGQSARAIDRFATKHGAASITSRYGTIITFAPDE